MDILDVNSGLVSITLPADSKEGNFEIDRC
jgi:hypothetical protein